MATTVDKCGPYLPLSLGGEDTATTQYLSIDVHSDKIAMGGYSNSPALLTSATIPMGGSAIIALVDTYTLDYIWNMQYYLATSNDQLSCTAL